MKKINLKQLLIRLFKINVNPINVYTINLLAYNNSEAVGRASGRTTRLADMYIQLLFSTGRICVSDHFREQCGNRHLMKIIINKLCVEHPGTRFEVERFNVIVLKNTFPGTCRMIYRHLIKK